MNDARHIATLRKGSSVAYWQPMGLLEAIIEIHPDHPPRMHYLDGRPAIDLSLGPNGAWLVPEIDAGTDPVIEIGGVGEVFDAAELPEMTMIMDAAQPPETAGRQ